MKKLMLIIVMASIAIIVNAQKPVPLPKPGTETIKIDPNVNPKITTKWVFDVKKLPLNGVYIKDIMADLNITLEVKEDINYGKALYFYSTKPISKVELTFKGAKTNSLYNDHTKSGHFYLESAVYAPGLKSGYQLLFYVKGIAEPVASAAATPLTIVK